VPFSSSDPDNFKKKCGFETFWDPAEHDREISPSTVGMTAVTLSQLITNGNAGICADGAMPNNTIVGFPAAGTYRWEIKTAQGGSTWHVRLRAMVSGSAAGNEFSAESVTIPGDIENTLEYKVNGTVTPHADVAAAMMNAVMTTGEAVTLDVAKSTGGASVFSAQVEIICVTKS
jgi:hypothetical protein